LQGGQVCYADAGVGHQMTAGSLLFSAYLLLQYRHLAWCVSCVIMSLQCGGR